MIYDAWNRTVKIKEGSTAIDDFEYDGMNRRILRVTGSEVRHFYYSTAWQVLEETLESPSETTDVQYVWGMRYIDDLILRDDGTETLYALSDANFNVTSLASTAGVVQQRIDVHPYGQVEFFDANFANAISNSKKWEVIFTGHRFDRVTGLHLMRNRFYHAQLGQFLSRDPIGTWGDYANLGNAYSYVGGAPADWVDPFGLDRRGHTRGHEYEDTGAHEIELFPKSECSNCRIVISKKIPGGGRKIVFDKTYISVGQVQKCLRPPVRLASKRRFARSLGGRGRSRRGDHIECWREPPDRRRVACDLRRELVGCPTNPFWLQDDRKKSNQAKSAQKIQTLK